ncbi:MAG: patatin-like phospholipase family protein [Nostoc sp. DedQUE05]|uniref:patatin-like phospholipase family protein n=1 Tax=Nostoc sp. DedQUE05 TaxID=3075391 RepID=UPI002AD2F0E6|nr:patatin-like phospholipase family protein [Nostoc sp. DedQUE05]MDZ8092950.1 patatin-like phospholipase family protein [Nostoc sp. DedQUE05]
MTFKILSLDGGGIRGVVSVQMLKEVESRIQATYGLELHQYFDMITGTSTGSIIAAGLAKGLNTTQLLKLYETKAEQIFPQPRNFEKPWRFVRNIFSPKYSHDGLEKALEDESALGETKIGEITNTILLILAYDMRYRNTTFFTNLHPDLGARWYDGIPLKDICISSASAPTFFPPRELKASNEQVFGKWSFPHIDGGVCANNPSLAAISQALKVSRSPKLSLKDKKKYNLENLKLEDISVLSIGTGRSANPFEYEQIKKWHTLNWVERLVDVFMEPTGEINSTICQNILGGFESGHYLRLDFDLNERYKPLANEDYKMTRTLIEKKYQRKNQYLVQAVNTNLKEYNDDCIVQNIRVNEEMDDSSNKNIKTLIAAAQAFIDIGLIYDSRVYGKGPKVKDAIEQFIKVNPITQATTNQTEALSV